MAQVATEEFENQTGGHKGNFLKPDSTKLMKAVSKHEGHFYSTLHAHPDLAKFLPRYFGSEIREGRNFVVLEDLTNYYKKPCIMDIKIGTQSFGEDAPPEKKEAMNKKDMKTTTVSLGFRVTALNVHTKSGEAKKRRKSWGKAITLDSMLGSIEEFLVGTHVPKQSLVKKFLALLRDVLNYFEKQSTFRFYSSSLLFLYDAEDPNPQDPRVDIRMIDFAHVFPINDGGKGNEQLSIHTLDGGYLFGLRNLIDHMERLA